MHNLFFTHLHSDHISDYLCFLMTRFDQCIGTEPDLHVYGPPPIKRITDGIWSPDGLFWYDVIARTNHPMSVHAYQMRGGVGDSRPEPVVHATEYAEGKVAAGEGWTCYAREVKHAQPYIECYGFRFETEEGVVAFSGDTAPIESVVELARDADLFVMEAVHREEKDSNLPQRHLRNRHLKRRAHGCRGRCQTLGNQPPVNNPRSRRRNYPRNRRGKKRLRWAYVLGAGHDGSGLVIGSGAMASFRFVRLNATMYPASELERSLYIKFGIDT